MFDEAQQELERARTLIDIGRAESASALLTRYLATDPASPEALCLLAQARLMQDDATSAASAVSAATAAIAAEPDGEWAHRLLALALGGCGRLEEAVGSAARAVELAPDLWQAHHTYAGALSDVGRSREAWEAANHAVALAPDEPNTHYLVAELSLRADAHDIAERALTTALALDPKHADSLNALGVVHLRKGRPTRAAGAFLDSATVDPRNLGGQNAETLVWNLLTGLEAGLAVALFALFAKTTPDEGAITQNDLRLLCLLGTAGLGVLVLVQLLRLPRLVRRLVLRAVSQRWGLLTAALLGSVLATANLAPYVAAHLRGAVIAVALILLVLAFLATMYGSDQHVRRLGLRR